MWISKKKYEAELDKVKWQQVDYNVKLRHNDRQNDRIRRLEESVKDLKKQVKKLEKYIKEGY
jgi:predicted  nucleic acid-binding Zn-ribbon protein